jgi:hypothetical protein
MKAPADVSSSSTLVEQRRGTAFVSGKQSKTVFAAANGK